MNQKDHAAPKFSTKGGFVGILVLIIVIISAFVGGYFVYNNLSENARVQKEINESLKANPTPTLAPVSDETANWKTYKNIKWNFTLRYPDTWTVKGPTNMDDFVYIRSPSDSEAAPYLFINEKMNSPKLSFKDFATEGLSPELKNEFIYTEEKLGSYTVYKTESLPGRFGGQEVFITMDGFRYILIGLTPYDRQNPWPDQGKSYTIFNQILSTFRFD